MTQPLTYTSYLKIDELLALQQPRSDGPEHDEHLFIIIHQVYELWFNEMLHELDYLMQRLEANDGPLAGHTFKRVLTILKVMVAQIDILETMTPINFLSFRERLESGSGFQSYQFRELEFTLGHKRRSAVDHYPEGSTGRVRLESRYAARTLWDAFLTYLTANGYEVGPALSRDVTQPVAADQAVQAILIDIYRTNPDVSGMCERMIDFDEGLQEWRYRHVQMVRRTIGNKKGTGGSAGADYLATTLFHPVFPDLWAVRTSL
jgi:tryptophan 2,3-dioxygenase